MPEKSAKEVQNGKKPQETTQQQKDPSLTPSDGGEQYIKKEENQKGQRYENQPPVQEGDAS